MSCVKCHFQSSLALQRIELKRILVQSCELIVLVPLHVTFSNKWLSLYAFDYLVYPTMVSMLVGYWR